MQDKYYIPQYLDQPFRVFLLTIDEFILLILPILLVGFVLNSMVIGFILGIGTLLAIKKFKGEQGHFYILNLIYWYFPPLIKFKATPPSYIQAYLG